MYYLGINTTYHELAACLIKDGQLIAAVEEERFNRVKHSKHALIDNPNTIPSDSIAFCLKEADITFRDIAKIGLSFQPKERLKNINIDTYFTPGDFGSKEGEELFYKKLMEVPGLLSQLAGFDISQKIEWVPHHIAHASSAFFVSPFDNAAILSIDGIGEIESTWLGTGTSNSLQKIKSITYPHSIGFLWEKFSAFLGFGEYGASKVMGLAAYGRWKKFYPQFQKIVSLHEGGEFVIDNAVLQFRKDNVSELETLFQLNQVASNNPLTEDHADLAAALQKTTDEVLIHLSKYLYSVSKVKNLCISGGVALNCVGNYEIMKTGYFENIYVQPAANDAGTALGAAYYLYSKSKAYKKSFVMDHVFWGPEYSDEEVQEVLNKEEVRYEKRTDIESAVAQLLTEGKIVGWFQGRMEWGPRALGNRSLLADPRNPHMKEILNLKIKKREPFRPFAPSVLKEFAKEWFEIPTDSASISTNFMEFAFPTKAEKQKIVPAITHVDGTSRIQTVTQQTNPKYYKLLSEFHKLTGVPMILNTSFNESEPIVCTPIEAINTFKRTRMDYLVINDFLIKRK